VRVVDGAYEVTEPEGKVRRLSVAELTGVAIETNDEGPFAPDVWWMLFGADDRVSLVWPLGARGDELTLDSLMQLPGIDLEKMIEATASTERGFFPLWRKPGHQR
jgi:hypothetical protein